MVRKVDKHLSLPLDLVERLEQQPNQSETVENALREWFDE